MFASLRYRLIASYVAVIFLCLFLAGSAFVLLLREYQQRIRMDQLADLSFPISFNVRGFETAGATPEQIKQIVRQLSDSLGVRIILTDRGGTVVDDTSALLDGVTISLPSLAGVERRADSFRPYFAVDEDGTLMVAPSLRIAGQGGRTSNYVVILAIPQANVAQAWWELAPSLGFAAVISLLVSVLVALFLTRSIARPLVHMTRASEEMARGRYDQSIPVSGRDEVARLANAFNAMAQQVSSSDRTMRDFLANVSHELKTPLTSIQGFSQALLDGTIQGEDGHLHAAGIINEESNAMRRLVDDLLTLSKIESGQIAMGDEVVDVDKTLRDAMRRNEWQAEAKSVLVELESPRVATVRGDLHWLGQVFTNLLDNALKHTPSGGRVTLRLESREHPVEAIVTVHNTGSYIPPADLPRVFERFFQVDRSRSARQQGSGLGLAIVREIVQAHGGHVDAASDPTFGTTFTVRLPLHGVSERTPVPFPIRRVA
jgi:signal transduction histidine kinase